MNLRIFVVVVFFFGWGSPALAQLTDADVAAAISIASQDEKVVRRMSDSCTAGLGWSAFGRAATGRDTAEYSVHMTTTRGMIAAQATENARRYLPFSPEDVSDEGREDFVYITVSPDVEDLTSIELSTLVQHVVIRPRKEDGPVFQPISVDLEGRTYSNLFGGSRDVTELLATFAPIDVATITDEDGYDKDLDVVIITSDGEQSCHLNKKKVREALSLGRLAG